jgi:hypothetical protein
MTGENEEGADTGIRRILTEIHRIAVPLSRAGKGLKGAITQDLLPALPTFQKTTTSIPSTGRIEMRG